MDNKDKETTADEEQLSNLKGKFVLMAQYFKIDILIVFSLLVQQ